MINVILKSAEKACCKTYSVTTEEMRGHHIRIPKPRVMFFHLVCNEIGLRPIDAAKYLGNKNPSQATRYLKQEVGEIPKELIKVFKSEFDTAFKEYLKEI